MPTPAQLLAQNRNQNVAGAMQRYPRPGAEPWYGRLARFMPYIGPPAQIGHGVMQAIRHGQTRGWRENAQQSGSTGWRQNATSSGFAPDNGELDTTSTSNNPFYRWTNPNDPFYGQGGTEPTGDPTVEINPPPWDVEINPVDPNESGINSDAGGPDPTQTQPVANPGAIQGPRGTAANPLFGVTPSGQRMFNAGSGWLPIGQAPQNIRWAPNSGTGNWQASQYAQSQVGQDNLGDQPSLEDQPMERGSVTYAPARFQQNSGAPRLTTNPTGWQNFYNWAIGHG